MRIRKGILIFISLLCYFLVSLNTYAKIRVGIPFYKPPFVFDQNDGFDINIMNDICTRLHEHCEYHPMLFAALYAAFENNKIDLAIGGISISRERENEFIFSNPYLPGNGKFLVLANSPCNTIDDLEKYDLEKKKIGIVNGSTYEHYLVEHYSTAFSIISFP